MPKDVIVSLSTIPPRIQHLSKTIDSMVNQSIPPKDIRIYLPHQWSRFPDATVASREIDSRVTVIRVERDLGPVTKLAYAVAECHSPNTKVLAADDDMVYEPQWIERFLEAEQQKPNHCLVQAGGFVKDFATIQQVFAQKPRAKYKGLGYRLKRALTCLQWKPKTPYVKSGHVDIGEGWAGFFVSPDWFDESIKYIPDRLRLVDDVWISAYLASKGIPIWLIANAMRSQTSSVAQLHALNAIQDAESERRYLNNAAVHQLRDAFGIWRN